MIFETKDRDIDKVVRKIEKAIYQALGHEVAVILQTVAGLKDSIKANPFKRVDSEADVGKVVTFLSADPPKVLRLPFVIAKENVEILLIMNRIVFLACRRKPNGMFGFPNAFFEKEFGVPATTRNWTTVNKILELAEKA